MGISTNQQRIYFFCRVSKIGNDMNSVNNHPSKKIIWGLYKPSWDLGELRWEVGSPSQLFWSSPRNFRMLIPSKEVQIPIDQSVMIQVFHVFEWPTNRVSAVSPSCRLKAQTKCSPTPPNIKHPQMVPNMCKFPSKPGFLGGFDSHVWGIKGQWQGHLQSQVT